MPKPSPQSFRMVAEGLRARVGRASDPKDKIDALLLQFQSLCELLADLSKEVEEMKSERA